MPEGWARSLHRGASLTWAPSAKPSLPSASQALGKAALCSLSVLRGSCLSYVQTNRVLAWGLGPHPWGFLYQDGICPLSLQAPLCHWHILSLLYMPVRAGASQTLSVGFSEPCLELGYFRSSLSPVPPSSTNK